MSILFTELPAVIDKQFLTSAEALIGSPFFSQDK